MKKILKRSFIKGLFNTRKNVNGENPAILKGKGLLYGDTRLRIQKKDVGFDEIFDLALPSYKDSLPEWRNALKKECEKIEACIQKAIEDEKEAFYRYNKPFLGSYLYHDILLSVMKNDSIEDREIVSLLRGTADLLNTPLEYPDNAGKYNLLKEKDIFHAIHELREKSAINIKGYSLDGRLFFNSYKINKEGERLLSIILEHDPERIKKDSDIMLEIELDKLENMTDKEARDFMIVFKMAKSPTFFSVQKERIKENLKNAPDMIVKMIKMKENLETDSKKKEILKEMLNFTNETA